MKNVAILFTGVNNIAGGGGAERFFADFFTQYRSGKPKRKLFFITDKSSLTHFNSIGQLTSPEGILTFKVVHNRFKSALESLQVKCQIIFHRIKLVQIPLYNIHYYPLVRSIDRMPALFRPKIVYIVTDSFIPYFYNDDQGRGYNFKAILQDLFSNIRIDSVISWYELFKTFAEKNNLIKSKPEIYCISSRYTGKAFDITKAKKNHIVFASRLTLAKQPLMFVEAIDLLQQRMSLGGWTFFIYGKGHLEEEIQKKLEACKLTQHVVLTHKGDLTGVFEESKCFVSTQDFENFPSLAMNEAMAAGNAIISRNVGQTSLFVKDGGNGILLKKDNPEGLADALEQFIRHPEQHQKMGEESIRLTKEVHTFENFKNQMELFWEKTLNKN